MRIILFDLLRSSAFVVALLLTVPHPSFAAATITLSSSGNSVYSLTGTGMDGIAGMDIVVQYDARTLANPRVAPGGLIKGAMIAANPNTLGIVRIAIIRTTPITGSGDILSVTFDRKSTSPKAINSLTVKATDIDGKPLSAAVQIAK